VAMVNARERQDVPCIALNVPIAARLPICHQMSLADAPPIRLTTDAPGPDAVVSEVAWIT